MFIEFVNDYDLLSSTSFNTMMYANAACLFEQYFSIIALRSGELIVPLGSTYAIFNS